MSRELDDGPWWRQPWPWLLALGPALVIVAGFATWWLAAESNDGLVADDYYKQGLAINQTLARDQVAARLGLAARLTLAADGAVTLELQSGAGAGLPPEVSLRLTHPTRAGRDQSALLKGAGGVYQGRLDTPSAGRWDVLVEDLLGEWRLVGVLEAPQRVPLSLAPAVR